MKIGTNSVAFLVAGIAISVPSRPDEVDELVIAEMKRQHIPGLMLAVVQAGKTVKTGGYGLANVELGVPVSTETVFEIGSITKTFTATAVMLLAEHGKLRLDDTAAKHVPELPSAWSEITIGHLMGHRSGLPRDAFPLNIHTQRLEYSFQETIRMAAQVPLRFSPGTQWQYSNLGFELLREIVERVSKEKFGQVLKDRVLAPLGMTRTQLNDRQALIPNRAAGYEWKGKLRVADYVSTSYYRGAGGLMSTGGDLARWSAVLTEGVLLKKESLERMMDGALGWGVEWHRGRRRIYYSGGVLGFRSALAIYPDFGLAVIILCNVFPADPEAIGGAVAGHYEPGLLPLHLLPGGKDPNSERTKAIGAAIADLVAGKPAALFTEEFHADLERWPGKIARLKDRCGSRQPLHFLACDEVTAPLFRPGGRVRQLCHYRIGSGDDAYFYTFSLAEDGRICWFDELDREQKVSLRQRAPDLDVKLSQLLQAAFASWGRGIFDSPIVGKGLRAAFTPEVEDYCRRHFQPIREWNYISRDEVRGYGIERLGESVDRIVYYEMVGEEETLFLTAYLSADGRLVDWEPSYE